MTREQILNKLSKKLNPKRYEHSLGVEYTAACMAMVHGADIRKARLAGILHDCAKNIPTKEKLALAEKLGLTINKSERANPDLLHGKLGAYYAKEKYHVDDEEILDAISYHTTGRPDMTLLGKIIFTADYIEPNRKKIFELDIIRKEAFTDLDKCVIHILKNTLEYLGETTLEVDEMTKRTYEFYIKNRKQEDKE